MKDLEAYDIVFTGLKVGRHAFDWKVDRKLFDAFDVEDFQESHLRCSLDLEKKERLLILNFDINGSVLTTCDRCGEPVEVSVDLEDRLVVKFAESTDFSDDEVVFLNENANTLNVGQFIYEITMTGMPSRYVHAPGECDPEVDAYLEEQKEGETNKEKSDIDPRWEALKKLKTKDVDDGTS